MRAPPESPDIFYDARDAIEEAVGTLTDETQPAILEPPAPIPMPIEPSFMVPEPAAPIPPPMPVPIEPSLGRPDFDIDMAPPIPPPIPPPIEPSFGAPDFGPSPKRPEESPDVFYDAQSGRPPLPTPPEALPQASPYFDAQGTPFTPPRPEDLPVPIAVPPPPPPSAPSPATPPAPTAPPAAPAAVVVPGGGHGHGTGECCVVNIHISDVGNSKDTDTDCCEEEQGKPEKSTPSRKPKAKKVKATKKKAEAGAGKIAIPDCGKYQDHLGRWRWMNGKYTSGPADYPSAEMSLVARGMSVKKLKDLLLSMRERMTDEDAKCLEAKRISKHRMAYMLYYLDRPTATRLVEQFSKE